MRHWLTLRETCTELRLSARGVFNLIKNGQLYAMRLSRQGKKSGTLRILYPGPRLARFIEESAQHLEHVPLLSGREIADALSIKPATVRQLKKRGHLRGSKVGNTTLFTAAEIRRFLLKRERGKRRGRQMYNAVLVDWLRRVIDRDAEVDVQVLDTLLRQAVVLPEPEKSEYITRLWNHFDAINDLLRAARFGEKLPRSVPMERMGLREKVDLAVGTIRSLKRSPILRQL